MAMALLGACALALGASPAASASLSVKVYRAQRVCEVREARHAGCVGIRLLARSLTAADLHAAAARQAGEAAAGLAPAVTNKTPLAGGLTPQLLHAAYSLPTETIASAQQTIAIVDAYNDPTAEADLGVYDSQFGLPACTSANGCFSKVDQQGKTSPMPSNNGEWASEISLDVQMAHAVCQSCRLLLVEANSDSVEDLGAAVDEAVKLGASEISNSYEGLEEPANTAYVADWEHPGVVVTVSSGDCGYLDENCGGAAVNFPSDSPDVIAVGGTELKESGGHWVSKAWEGAGSSCSEVFSAPLWQTSLSDFSETGCAGKRASADVSADADPWTGVDVYDSTPNPDGYPTGWGIWGGTSASSPIVAAEFGLAGGAHGVSYPAATLYSNLGDARALTDVTSGHNGSCKKSIICEAAAGYDGPTGVGSPLGLDAFFPGAAPQGTAAPTISGTAEQGQTLSAHDGSWSGEPSATSVQWEVCNASGSSCSAITGATKQTYTIPTTSDLGATLRVQESASNHEGTGAPAISAQTAAIASNLPTIASFTPTSGITGSKVTITGTHLNEATKVHIDGLDATFEALSATQLEATVPNGASAGTIVVITPSRTVTSTDSFTPTLSITSFAPQSAFAGKTVTITGVGFNAGSSVSFGEVLVHTVYVSPTKLEVTVPDDAPNGDISVTNNSAPLGTVYSATAFTLA